MKKNNLPQLLKKTDEKTTYRVHVQLQQDRRCLFEYNDRTMARDHFELLRAVGVIGHLAIKDIRFEE